MLAREINSSKPRQRRLTYSEIRIMELLSAGKMYKEIALELNVCIDTVKKHCTNMYRKLAVSNRIEAINKYYGRYSTKV